jgi:hypothetical protein
VIAQEIDLLAGDVVAYTARILTPAQPQLVAALSRFAPNGDLTDLVYGCTGFFSPDCFVGSGPSQGTRVGFGSLPVPTSGRWTLELGLVDVDAQFSEAGLFDNVRVNRVPLPGTLTLVAVGLAAALQMRRVRSRRGRLEYGDSGCLRRLAPSSSGGCAGSHPD